nr:uncharacterized protein LOC115264266 [Aedes albopictus]
MSCRGKTQLSVNGHLYTCDKTTDDAMYWCCNQRRVLGCTARANTGRRKQGEPPSIKLRGFHNHGIIAERRRPGEYARLKEQYDRERKVLPDVEPRRPARSRSKKKQN